MRNVPLSRYENLIGWRPRRSISRSANIHSIRSDLLHSRRLNFVQATLLLPVVLDGAVVRYLHGNEDAAAPSSNGVDGLGFFHQNLHPDRLPWPGLQVFFCHCFA